jgi:hypothetical protein
MIGAWLTFGGILVVYLLYLWRYWDQLDTPETLEMKLLRAGVNGYLARKVIKKTEGKKHGQ